VPQQTADTLSVGVAGVTVTVFGEEVEFLNSTGFSIHLPKLLVQPFDTASQPKVLLEVSVNYALQIP
jgi:hypothetical protein